MISHDIWCLCCDVLFTFWLSFKSCSSWYIAAPPTLGYDDRYQHQILRYGDLLKIHANIGGTPLPSVIWYKDGIPIRAFGRTSIETYDTMASLVIKRVEKEDDGTYRCVARNKVGDAHAEFGVTITDVPTSPTGPIHIIEVQSEMITIEWGKPRDDGGAAIKYFIVERRETNRQSWSRVGRFDGNRTRCNCSSLIPGAGYHFRVYAENDVGQSKPLETEFPTTAKNQYGKCNQVIIL